MAEYEGGDERPDVPPNDLDAEAAVLSVAMLAPVRVAEVDFLLPKHFYSEAHRQVWKAVLELRAAGGTIDILTVSSHLKDTQRLAQVGGTQYLAQILDAAPVVPNVRAYGAIVFEKWRLRQALLGAQRIVAACYHESIPNTQEFLNACVKGYVQLANESAEAELASSRSVLRQVVDQMAAASRIDPESSEERTPGIPTGMREFDRQLLGLGLTQKITVLAESGRGKSTMALQWAMHAAGWRGIDRPLADERVAVLFFSTEMGKEELANKKLANACRIDSRRLERAMKNRTLSQDEWDRIGRALPMLEQLRIIGVYKEDITVDQIVATTKQVCERALATEGMPVGLVIVDHLHRLKVPEHMARLREDQQLGEMSKALKNLAKATNTAVVELAQMNPPDPKLSPSGRPYKWLARGSKRIEHEADKVVCIWRLKRDVKRDCRITVTKMRGGDEFDMDVSFEPEYSRFFDPMWEGYTPELGY